VEVSILDLICIEFFKKMIMKKVKFLSIVIPTLVILFLSSAFLIASCESATYQDISAVITDPTYSKNIEPIMAKKCTGCHSTSGNDDQPYLENYDQVKEATQNGTLLCRIDGSCGSVMPPTGEKLPQATINMIQLWATNEYPN
jgi:hypothetical protein